MISHFGILWHFEFDGEKKLFIALEGFQRLTSFYCHVNGFQSLVFRILSFVSIQTSIKMKTFKLYT